MCTMVAETWETSSADLLQLHFKFQAEYMILTPLIRPKRVIFDSFFFNQVQKAH